MSFTSCGLVLVVLILTLQSGPGVSRFMVDRGARFRLITSSFQITTLLLSNANPSIMFVFWTFVLGILLLTAPYGNRDKVEEFSFATIIQSVIAGIGFWMQRLACFAILALIPLGIALLLWVI